MGRFFPAAALTSASVFCASAAVADVTAQDIWADLRSYLETTGYTVETTAEERSGDTLTVSGLKAFFVIEDGDGDGDGRVEIALDEIRFRELSNGSVEIGLSDTHTLSITGGEAGENLNLVLTSAQTGLSIIAGGSADETSYDIVASELSMETTTFEVDGEPIDGAIAVDLSSYTAGYTLSGTDVITIRGEGRIDGVEITAKVNEPDEDVVLDISSQIRGLSVTLDTTVPQSYDPTTMTSILADGFGGTGDYMMSSLAFDLSGQIDGEAFEVAATTGPADFSLSLTESGFAFAEHARDINIAVSASSMPLPTLVLSAAEYGLDLLLPVAASPEAQEYKFGIRLVDLALPDEVWRMTDPSSALPHAPLTFVLETSGAARLMGDPFDPEAMSGGDVPAEIDSLSLDDLNIVALGTELTGSGAFTFDNTDTASFDGIPRPEGQLNLRLTGANALLDTLVSMGLLPEDQAMGARMMMGLFTVVGPGEDELTSTIEINAEGQVLANGQRLR